MQRRANPVRLIVSDCRKRREYEGNRFPVAFKWCVEPGFIAGVLLRFAQAASSFGFHALARSLTATNYSLLKIQVDPRAAIGERLLLRRAMGVVIHGNAVIGDDVILSESTSIGERTGAGETSEAVLGDRVVVEAAAYVLAGARVGDDAVVGPNTTVAAEVPANHEIIGNRARSRDEIEAPGDSRPPQVDAGADRMSLGRTLELIRGDVRRRVQNNRKSTSRIALEAPLVPPTMVLISYRVSRLLYCNHLRWLARLVQFWTTLLLGADIHPSARIGAEFYMSHSLGVAIGPDVRIGDGVYVAPHSSLDRRACAPAGASPIIEDGSFIGDRAVVVGRSTVGERSMTGSTCVIADAEFEPRMLLLGSPARSRRMDDRYDEAAEESAHPPSPEPGPGVRRTLELIRADKRAWRAPTPQALARPIPGIRGRCRRGQQLVRYMNMLHAKGLVPIARLVFMWGITMYGFEFVQGVTLGPGFRLEGVYGSIVRAETVFGRNVSVGNNLSIGGNIGKVGLPVIKDDVTLCSGSALYGPLTIGEGTTLGPKAMTISDIPPNVVASGYPARWKKSERGAAESPAREDRASDSA